MIGKLICTVALLVVALSAVQAETNKRLNAVENLLTRYTKGNSNTNDVYYIYKLKNLHNRCAVTLTAPVTKSSVKESDSDSFTYDFGWSQGKVSCVARVPEYHYSKADIEYEIENPRFTAKLTVKKDQDSCKLHLDDVEVAKSVGPVRAQAYNHAYKLPQLNKSKNVLTPAFYESFNEQLLAALSKRVEARFRSQIGKKQFDC